ncbi:MAG: NifU N-terminal domain-containing protein [Planctomycetota bacterium]
MTSFEATPNPNATKCIVDRPPTDRPRSYFDAESASGDPLAEALFAIEGVTTVLIHTAFITVNKTPDADWGAVRAGVERALVEHG